MSTSLILTASFVALIQVRINDSHTLPYFGIAYWERIMEALAEIDYKGDFTYKACCFIEKIPDDLIGDYLKVMERTGRYLINIFDNAKNQQHKLLF